MSGLVILLYEGLLNYTDLKYAFSHLNNQIVANYLVNEKCMIWIYIQMQRIKSKL